MRILLSTFTALILVSTPVLAQQQNQQATVVPPRTIDVAFDRKCDKGVAIYKMQNQGDRWKAKAMVTFMGGNGEVLFQRALRMAKGQSMAYRVRQPDLVGEVVAFVDYPGTPRVQNKLGAPCR